MSSQLQDTIGSMQASISSALSPGSTVIAASEVIVRVAAGAFGSVRPYVPFPRYGSCAHLNDCSGHGKCNFAARQCVCYEGWGGPSDVTSVRAPDCSLRSCPAGRPWGIPPDVATLAECSEAGICNRASGVCACNAGFAGPACERTACPNACSQRGECLPAFALPMRGAAAPLGPNRGVRHESDTARLYACVCNSAWPVGYGAGERQLAEFSGADCHAKQCASGDDPLTTLDETDCFLWDRNRAVWMGPVYASSGLPVFAAQQATSLAAAQAAYDFGQTVDSDGDGIIWNNATWLPGATNVGQKGNLCHVPCSNRGACDAATGKCTCFAGYMGAACEVKQAHLPRAKP